MLRRATADGGVERRAVIRRPFARRKLVVFHTNETRTTSHNTPTTRAAALASRRSEKKKKNPTTMKPKVERAAPISIDIWMAPKEKKNPPEGVEDHGEEDELAQQRHHQTGGRNNLGQQQEEHGQREQDRYGQTDLIRNGHSVKTETERERDQDKERDVLFRRNRTAGRRRAP